MNRYLIFLRLILQHQFPYQLAASSDVTFSALIRPEAMVLYPGASCRPLYAIQRGYIFCKPGPAPAPTGHLMGIQFLLHHRYRMSANHPDFAHQMARTKATSAGLLTTVSLPACIHLALWSHKFCPRSCTRRYRPFHNR